MSDCIFDLQLTMNCKIRKRVGSKYKSGLIVSKLNDSFTNNIQKKQFYQPNKNKVIAYVKNMLQTPNIKICSKNMITKCNTRQNTKNYKYVMNFNILLTYRYFELNKCTKQYQNIYKMLKMSKSHQK